MLDPIIIIGCRRSGTTLLRTMLDRHPDLLVHPAEPQFILGLYYRFGTKINNLPATLNYITTHSYLPENLDVALLKTTCQQANVRTLKQLINCYIKVWGGNLLNNKHLVLKDPAFIFELDLIYHLFPTAHLVHIVRDPHGNVSSQYARWTRSSIWECAMWWRNAVREARQWQSQQKLPYIELKYEDLVLNPNETLQDICQRLNIPYYKDMLHFDLKSTLYKPSATPKPIHFKTVDPSRLTVWQKQLTPLEIKLVETCCINEMSWWDYKTTNPKVATTSFFTTYLKERLFYKVLITGRYTKNILRKIKWRLGFE